MTDKKVSVERMLRHLDNDILFARERKEKYLDGTYAGNIYPEAAKACELDIEESQAIRDALLEREKLKKLEKKVAEWKKRIVEDIGLERGDEVMDEGAWTLDLVKSLLDEIRDFVSGRRGSNDRLRPQKTQGRP